MADLALHKISEDANTITLGWTPVGDRGYRYTREKANGKWSNTWDATRSSAKFAKDSAWYRVEALGLDATGDYPPVGPPPSPTLTVTQSVKDGDTISAPIVWTAQPSAAVTKVEFFVDGVRKWTENAAPYVFNGDETGRFDPASVTAGSHALKVIAYDASGATASATATVTTKATAPTPPPVTGRVDLSTKASNIAGMLSWLRSNPQPAFVPPGSYPYSSALDLGGSVDLLFDRAILLPSNPDASVLRVQGSGTRLTFQGACRIGAAGSRNSRLDNGETDGINMWGASNFVVHADDLTIEGVRNTGLSFRRGCSHGVVTGKITCIHTGADSFHVTQGANFLDFSGATFVANGGGDDMFPVVSYAEDGVLCHDIHWGTCIGRDCPARGMAVVGCSPTVTMDSLDVDGTDAAGIYIACEPSYITYGVDGVVVKAAKIRNPSRDIHDANVLIYSGRAGYTIKNVVITCDPDPNKELWRKTGDSSVSNVKVNGQAVS